MTTTYDTSYFDTSLDMEPVTEQQQTPVLPEERHVFEFLGITRSEPDEYRKQGGIKWTWRVFHEDGRTPFVFNDEQYLFFRTTNHDPKTRKPLFILGTDANDWAAALLGRTLGVDAYFDIKELAGKRMSAMVVWERQKRDKSKWTVKLASLRHVPTAPVNGAAPRPAPGQVSADPSDDEVDRAALVIDLQKAVKTLKRFDAEEGAKAASTVAASDLDDAPMDELRRLLGEIQEAISTAMDT
jgi:hypothetical protein